MSRRSIVCDKHLYLLDEGAYILCPPMRDLLLLRKWENRDWKSRVYAKDARDRRVPPPYVSPPSMAPIVIAQKSFTDTNRTVHVLVDRHVIVQKWAHVDYVVAVFWYAQGC